MGPERVTDPAAALARVDPQWDAEKTEHALAGLHRRVARRRATTAIAALSVIALGALTVADAAHPSAATEAIATDRVVRLADGSEVAPDEGSQVIVEHVSGSRISVRIDRGGASIDVVPGLPRRFEVRAGAVTVIVLGTAFRVERLDDVRARVSVTRGHVDVAWAGGHADLVAGDGGVFPTGEVERVTRVVGSPGAATPAPDVVDAPPPTSDHVHRVASTAAPLAWRQLAHEERYDEAYAALGSPAESARTVGDGVDDLLLAADVARLSGHPAEALPRLEAVERDHPSDPRAVLAGFTRGRLLMELARPAEAAEQLERVLAMEPSGSLAEDALARAALAHAAAGHRDTASTLAERYLASYPSGRWSSRVRGLAEGATPR